jgi:hypothetical protein
MGRGALEVGMEGGDFPLASLGSWVGGDNQSLTRCPKGAPTTTTEYLSRQTWTNNVTTTIIGTKIYQSL